MTEEADFRGLERKWLRWLIGGVLVVVACTLLFARTVDRDLNHDEHQFLAPAALLNREGLQPWRDYPLFHLPNLVFAYAAADRLTGDLIFGAKLVCFAASAFVITALAVAGMRTANLTIATVVTAAALALLLGDPLFLYTAGKTWNHEVPTALLLGSIAALAAAAERNSLPLTALTGILAGLAVGCRLTFAPTLIGLFLFAWLIPLPFRRRAAHAGILTLAATVALAPSLYYLFTQPEAFIFGNLEFPRLRLLDVNDVRAQETIVWWRKLRFFFKEIVRGSWPIFLLWLALGMMPAWRWLRKKPEGDITAAIIFVCFPFVMLGCFTPSRYQYQHYFVFIPLLIYGIVIGLRLQQGRKQLAWTGLTAIIAAIFALRSAREYAALRHLTQPEEWFSTRAKTFGKRLQPEISNPGRILTLAPSFVLSGNLQIYPQLATGVFAWRGAPHVPFERRQKLHLIAPEDLAKTLSLEPPAALLTGVEEEEEEQPLLEWAKKQGYRAIDQKKKRVLWVPAQR